MKRGMIALVLVLVSMLAGAQDFTMSAFHDADLSEQLVYSIGFEDGYRVALMILVDLAHESGDFVEVVKELVDIGPTGNDVFRILRETPPFDGVAAHRWVYENLTAEKPEEGEGD